MDDAALEPIEEGHRLRALAAAEGLLRLMRAAVEAYGDLDTANVYLTAVAASAGGASRDPEVIARFSGETPVPEAFLRPVSRRAIALATGLSRETARRKIAGLVADGWLVEDRGGVRGPFNMLEHGPNLAFSHALIAEFERTAGRIRRPRREGGDAAAGPAGDGSDASS